VLRGRLGFEGLVITDALNMGGVTRHYSVAEASILALLAGADVLLQPPGHPQVIDRIVAAVESGRIPPARIEEAARRVLLAKAAAGLHRARAWTPKLAGRTVGAPAHPEVARQVAERSITLARDEGGAGAAAPGARVLHVTYTSPPERGPGGGAAPRAGRRRHAPEHVRVGPATPAATFARSAGAPPPPTW
jgi:beta-N-acetylhexosaminidase